MICFMVYRGEAVEFPVLDSQLCDFTFAVNVLKPATVQHRQHGFNNGFGAVRYGQVFIPRAKVAYADADEINEYDFKSWWCIHSARVLALASFKPANPALW